MYFVFLFLLAHSISAFLLLGAPMSECLIDIRRDVFTVAASATMEAAAHSSIDVKINRTRGHSTLHNAGWT